MTFTRSEKLFIFFAMCSAALICGEYAITRPTSNALFLTLFSVKAYPWVWLATVPLNLFAIYLYNRFLPKIGPLKMVFSFAITTILINTFSCFFYNTLPHLIFFQYAWKDIYVLLMLKQLWSMIHSTIPASRAKYLYGCIYGMGTVGAVAGSVVPGFWAVTFGSEQILLATLPIYLLLMFTYATAFRRSGVKSDTFQSDLTPNPRPGEALSLIRKSPILIAVLLLVIFMQVSVALIEYQFNAHLELAILEKDLRTAYCGKLTCIINLCSLILQFLGGFLMVRTLGLRGSHFLIPVLLCSSALFSFVVPTFAALTFSYAFLKAIDFSLFGVIREMLYVPLALDAKYRAKAIIDVFAYRTSKALISFGLIFLQIVAGTYLLPFTSYASIAIFIAWFAVVAILFRKRAQFETI
ncbi:MAG TPA: Npt1/Npt2 family nucleotide transporter [Chlamydiales bacterium]|nr:Npt1/Npt2 family nucleotide transporter [Chlamydiales bacterium]